MVGARRLAECGLLAGLFNGIVERMMADTSSGCRYGPVRTGRRCRVTPGPTGQVWNGRVVVVWWNRAGTGRRGGVEPRMRRLLKQPRPTGCRPKWSASSLVGPPIGMRRPGSGWHGPAGLSKKR